MCSGVLFCISFCSKIYVDSTTSMATEFVQSLVKKIREESNRQCTFFCRNIQELPLCEKFDLKHRQ